jgi:hypothetical protein
MRNVRAAETVAIDAHVLSIRDSPLWHWHAQLMMIPLFEDLGQVWSVWKEECYQRRVTRFSGGSEDIAVQFPCTTSSLV